MTLRRSEAANGDEGDTEARRAGLARRWDFVRGVIHAQIRLEFDRYLLGWLWWILEPFLIALTFFIVVKFFVPISGQRFWIIFISVLAWRWFSRTVEQAPHLSASFGPYLRTGGVSLRMLFSVFVLKELVVFLIAAVALYPLFGVFAHAPTLALLPGVPALIACQLLVTYAVATLAFLLGSVIRDSAKVIALVVSIWFYLSPGLYLHKQVLDRASPTLVQLLKLNPFWSILDSWQNIVVRGRAADYAGLGMVSAAALAGCLLAAALLALWRRRLTLLAAAEIG
jgi:lipopolysaccharide transport system permease protein